MKPFLKTAKTAAVLTISLSLSFVSAPAFASGTKMPEHTTTRISYDWHKNAKSHKAGNPLSVKERKRLAAMKTGFGRGSYICSPSGFGKKSKCYSRN